MTYSKADHRARAIRIGLAEIDRLHACNEAPTTRAQWRPMLQRLIDREDAKGDGLKYKPRNGTTVDLVPLTSQRFENILMITVRDHSTIQGPVVRARIFAEGSTLLQPKWLKKNGYALHIPQDVASSTTGTSVPTPGAASLGNEAAMLADLAPPASEPSPVSAPQMPILESSSPLLLLPILTPENTNAVNPIAKTDRGNGEPHQKKQKREGTLPSGETFERPATFLTKPADTLTRASGPARIPVFADMTEFAKSLEPVGLQDITEAMKTIMDNTLFAAHHSLKDGANRRAAWLIEPQPELDMLYKQLFGHDYLSRMLHPAISEMGALNALQACYATAVFGYIFARRLDWDGPAEVLAKFDNHMVNAFNEPLQEKGIDLTLKKVVWDAARTKLVLNVEGQFKDLELKNLANEWAKKLANVLAPQLHALTNSSQDQVGHLTVVVSAALSLRGRLRAAPHYYDYRWVTSGTSFDDASMEEVGQNAGAREVLWCLTPTVLWRATPAEEWCVAARAKVYARSVSSGMA
ncbi:hypothetical protein LTS10_011277 [Elasticomyces elasticus]|nr:hypothetical protein LTS10_011277 [Elasticomyces elasticus]